MTKNELAKLLKKTPRQVDNYVAEGMPRVKRGAIFDYGIAAVVWHFERKLERLESERPASLDAERAALVRTQRQLAEYDLELHNIGEAQQVLQDSLNDLLGVLSRKEPDDAVFTPHKCHPGRENRCFQVRPDTPP